jgi:tripeptide aminopeptidase
MLLDEVIKTFSKITEENGAKIEVKHEFHIEAYETPRDHSVVKRFQNICKKLDIPCNLCATLGGSDNNNMVMHGINGLELSAGMNSCHSCEEYTYVSELEKITEIVLELMQGDA